MKWDLTRIYSDEKALKKEVDSLYKQTLSFGQYEGCLDHLSEEELRRVLSVYMRLRDRIYKLSVFSFFVVSENPEQFSFYEIVQNDKQVLLQRLAFLEKEIVKLPKVKVISREKKFSWIKNLIADQKHIVKDSIFFAVRKELSALYVRAKNEKNRYFDIIKQSIGLNNKLAAIKHFPSRLAYQNGYNFLPDEVVWNVCQSITDTFPKIAQPLFSKISQKKGHKITLSNWKSKKARISFDQIQKLVIDSFTEFDGRYQKILTDLFDERRIYVGPVQNAYSCQVCSKIKPYVFMSFEGTLNSLAILAHELGHYIQQYAHRKKGAVYYDPPFIISETIAIFFEFLVLDSLAFQNTRMKRDLNVLRDERVISSLYIQSILFLFEQEIYEKQNLEEKNLDRIWMKYNRLCFGDALDEKAARKLWQNFPYMINNPFYDFNYMMSSLIALNLLEKYKTDHAFLKKFNQLIKNTAYTDYYSVLREQFNIDVFQPDFIQNSIKRLGL